MQQIDEYLQQFRLGDRDIAFFGLLELGREVLPTLMVRFRTENDYCVRAFIVELIRQYQEPSTAPFLEEAIHDTAPEVWKQAMDGLVSLASQPALDILRSAKSRPFLDNRDADNFHRWIDEAIEQIELEIQRTWGVVLSTRW